MSVSIADTPLQAVALGLAFGGLVVALCVWSAAAFVSFRDFAAGDRMIRWIFVPLAFATVGVFICFIVF
ncbi:MAG: hypothetical protein KDD85_05915 [Parvularculaceae bacterium]|nr:hypothetical protein [Parvularculaceae bacterium]